MFAEERQEKLLSILREKRKVAVSEMCEVFNVSGATIRADLRQLEEAGMLTPHPRRRRAAHPGQF
ncbi:DNA-bindng transcriptional repressor SrlR [Raoultella planticola]|uniref:DNA-bindng transcriptional repressor SrlR n=1 Tax=Raoultella planticola TaxID=575 RepID=A0A485CW85_RAOPL|nr:DNA-bindng transcriptional repressor SrlR [Raoultella planticola]